MLNKQHVNSEYEIINISHTSKNKIITVTFPVNDYKIQSKPLIDNRKKWQEDINLIRHLWFIQKGKFMNEIIKDRFKQCYEHYKFNSIKQFLRGLLK
jgi:hypothetical protein